jgi:geranylgeranyl diphosphate/geranylgeranyl-bacteriochlorophyllide a reductase
MISPKSNKVDIPVGQGFVGMVDRDVFDEWLRARAESAGAERRTGGFHASRATTMALQVLTYTDGRSRHGVEKQVKTKIRDRLPMARSRRWPRPCIPGSRR